MTFVKTCIPARWLRALLKRHNLDHLNFRYLRHTSATFLLERAITMGLGCKRHGYAVTLDIYTRIFSPTDATVTQ